MLDARVQRERRERRGSRIRKGKGVDEWRASEHGKNGKTKKLSTSSFSLFISHPLQFDSAFLAALSTKVSGKAAFKGRLDTYRFCDAVWTFVLRDAVIKLPAGPGGRPAARDELVKKVKVVAVDSRLAARP